MRFELTSLQAAGLLAEHGADPHWASSCDGLTPVEAARHSHDEEQRRDPAVRQRDRRFADLVQWLEWRPGIGSPCRRTANST